MVPSLERGVSSLAVKSKLASDFKLIQGILVKK